MKKLSMTAFLVILLTTGAFGHEGSLGLYTDEIATACQYVPAIFEQFDVYVLYIRSDGGPDGISAFEFKLYKSTTALNIISATWQQGFITQGDVENGISVSVPGCYGSGMAMAPLGSIKMFSTSAPLGEDEFIKVEPDPGALEPGIWVTECEYPKALHMVLGGYFKFYPDACNKSIEPASWGAIKAQFE